MRYLTVSQYILERFNERLAREGSDVRIVASSGERPKPMLAQVLPLKRGQEQERRDGEANSN